MPHLRDRLPKITFKKILCLQSFLQKFGILKLPIWSCPAGLIYVQFKDFIHITENVARTIYVWRVIPQNKLVPNWIEAS